MHLPRRLVSPSLFALLVLTGCAEPPSSATAAPPAGPTASQAQPLAAPAFQTLYAHARRRFQVTSFPWRPEITPQVIGLGNGRRLYTHPGSVTHLCLPSGNDNLINGDVRPQFSECLQLVKAARFSGVDAQGNALPNGEWDGQNDQTGFDIWNFTYDGAFGVVLEPGTQKLFLVRHNEHQNVLEGPSALGYQGHIVPSRSVWVTGQRAGYWGPDGIANTPDDTWVNDWPASPGGPPGGSFGSFISLARVDIDPNSGAISAGTYKDYGPITWPSTGYLPRPSRGESTRPGTGHQLPTLFYPTWLHDPQGDAWMYAFYVNGSDTDGTGIPQCISVSRGWAGQEVGYVSTVWRNWDGAGWNVPSVPADMRLNDMERFYTVDTPPGAVRPYRAACVAGEPGWYSVWFQVAKVLDAAGNFTGYYLAAEERTQGNLWQMGIRISGYKNLTQWSPLTVIDSSPDGWGTGRYTYPTFYNLEGTSNSAIRSNDFFILGARPSEGGGSPYYLYRLQLTHVP